MPSTPKTSAVPSAMEEKLRSIRTRQTVIAVLRAVALGAAVLLAAMMLVMTIDWMFILFSTGLRTLLTTLAVASAVVALLTTAVPPVLRIFRWTRAARDVDQHVPQLEERWTTVANFAVSKHQPTSPTAQAMLNQVTSEAAAMGQLVKPKNVANRTVLKPALLMLAGCCLLMSGFLALNWPQTSVLLKRFWSPTSNITATQLTSRTGDVVLPRGETLNLIVEQTGMQRESAVLSVEHETGIVDVYEVSTNEEQADTFLHSLRADGSFRYRMRAGDGESAWHTVSVIDYPTLEAVQLTVTAPEYVDRPVYEKELIPGRIKAIQGSQFDLRMKPAAPLERLQLTLSIEGGDDETPTERYITLTADGDGWYRFQTQLIDDFTLSPKLFGAHGLTKEDLQRCRIQVIADKAPVARVISPTDEMAVAVDDVIDIEFEAHDDHGIATAELVVYDESETDENGEPEVLYTQPIPLGDQELKKHVMAQTKLDLKQLDLEEGRNISYAVRVADNRMLSIEPTDTDKEVARVNAGESPQNRENANESKRDVSLRGDSEPTDASKPGQRSDTDSPTEAMLLADATVTEKSPQKDPRPENGTPQATEGKSEIDMKAEDRDGKEPADPQQSTTSNSESEPSASAEQGKTVDIHKPNETHATSDPENLPSSKSIDSPRQNDVMSTEEGATADGDTPTPQNTDTDADVASADASTDDDPKAMAPGPDGRPQTDSPSDDLTEATQSGNPTDSKPAGKDGMPVENGEELKPAAEGDSNAELSERMLANGKKSETDSDNADPENAKSQNSDDKSKSAQTASNGNSKPTVGKPKNQSDTRPGPSEQVAMNPQQAESRQNVETNRRKLKIAQRLSAVAESTQRRAANMEIRDRVVEIDEMLADVETGLTRIVEREIPDADRTSQFQIGDTQLGEVETYISELRKETRDHQFAFVGLQMVDIGRTHVTPARDLVFVAIRDPKVATKDANESLQFVVRARERLAALLIRYDRVVQERELAGSLDEAVQMYEVYVEKSQQLMREARQNKNPLDRKMAVIEVDQEYLDRYAEVLTLRREMMAEFARILGDDPRLLARYMDLITRRRTSLRDQLTELAQRQEETFTELSSWQAISDAQRENLWMLIAQVRLQGSTPLAKDASELAESIEKQMPLVLENAEGTASVVIKRAHAVAATARDITFDARRILDGESGAEQDPPLVTNAERLVEQFRELDAALDQLSFENESNEEVTTYVTARLLESRTVADDADAWAVVAKDIQQSAYHGLAEVDQRKIAIATELLRVEMLDIENDLNGQFQQQLETNVPGPIVDLVRELQRLMESITFNQAAATRALTRQELVQAEDQELQAVQRFAQAEELFDRMRRAVVMALDEYDPPDPNIADLVDPTLDEFLAQLEREPNIQALLGIPNRPRNLRVIAETLQWQQNGGAMMGDAQVSAMKRAREAMQMKRGGRATPPKPPEEMTEAERQERENATDLQEMLEKSLASIRERAEDAQTSEEQRRQLENMAQNMQRMLDQASEQNPDARDWERIAESDQAKAILRALAKGEAIPDDQWNKLLSTLDDGLWQVRGKTPPEVYRRAIEQYQDRIRQLMTTISDDAD